MKKTLVALLPTLIISALTVVPSMAATPEATAKAQQVVATIITPGMTEVQKVQACNNYLMQNVTYDFTEQHYTADSALLYGTAVCEGYSEAFKLLMDLCGIPCEVVVDYDLDHSWNRVYIGGIPYEVDVTWNDANNTNSLTLLSADQMANAHYNLDFDSDSWGTSNSNSAADLEDFAAKVKAAASIKRQ